MKICAYPELWLKEHSDGDLYVLGNAGKLLFCVADISSGKYIHVKISSMRNSPKLYEKIKDIEKKGKVPEGGMVNLWFNMINE